MRGLIGVRAWGGPGGLSAIYLRVAQGSVMCGSLDFGLRLGCSPLYKESLIGIPVGVTIITIQDC